MTTVSICGQNLKIIYLLFLLAFSYLVLYFTFNYTACLGESSELLLGSSYYFLPLDSSQKVSYSSISYYWSPFPILFERYFNPATLHIEDLEIAIQIDSTKVLYPKIYFLEIRSKKVLTYFTRGSCI